MSGPDHETSSPGLARRESKKERAGWWEGKGECEREREMGMCVVCTGEVAQDIMDQLGPGEVEVERGGGR